MAKAHGIIWTVVGAVFCLLFLWCCSLDGAYIFLVLGMILIGLGQVILYGYKKDAEQKKEMMESHMKALAEADKSNIWRRDADVSGSSDTEGGAESVWRR